jgi:valyl-tRNA synthetase
MDKLYQHIEQEAQAQKLWEAQGTYNFVHDAAKKVFSIDTPPPTVSGTLHIGHVFSYTHADLVARFKRMSGYNVFYPMGFDDNGLPTERFVEKKNSTKAHLLKRSDFIKLCLKETHDVEKLFEGLWRNLGLSIDWTKIYSTISDPVRRVSQHSFLDLYKKDYIYRKEEPALYCTTCRTSVAQAELDSAEVSTNFNTITFQSEAGEPLHIATTRPELLPACVAVFYHPTDARYTKLAGTFATTPVFGKKVPLLADEKVDPAKGTGLVMCCTFGDQTDIHWFKTHKLPFVQVVGFDGKWTAVTGELAGLNAHDARKKVLELLAASNALIEQKPITHNVSTHERCRQEIEYLILRQWFVKILEHKEAFLKMGDQINWYPDYMKSRYRDWVSNLNWDWCISRQRFFGIPFPVWHCQDCQHVITPELKDLPVDPQEQQYNGGKCTRCASTNVMPDTDVMDTWNTSALTPQINTHWPDGSPDQLTMPMSMRPQAHDIIRTWAFYTIVKAHYHNGCIPWQDIMISGHVLAGKEKISKSKGNSKTTPEALLATYPADVIRYWAANGRIGTDTAFSETQLKIGQRLLTKLWNACLFISEHVGTGYDLTNNTQQPVCDVVNQWILHNFSAAINQYHKLFDAYEYQPALEAVEKFFWQDFCDNYLELVKDRLFNPGNYDAAAVEETKRTLYDIGYGLLQLLAPFIPHITESIYQSMYKHNVGTPSLHTTVYATTRFTYDFKEAQAVMTSVLAIVSAVRKLKSEKQLSLKTPLALLHVHNATNPNLALQGLLIAGITKATQVSFAATSYTGDVLEGEEANLIAHVTL